MIFAAVLAGAALFFAFPPRVTAPTLRWWGMVVPAALLVLGLCAGRRFGPSAVALGIALILVIALRRSQRKRAAAVRNAASVRHVCEELASELSAGLPPGRALESAATDWPVMDSVVTAFRLGGSVPDALRNAARVPGAEDLRLAAAAWQMAQRSGGGLGIALARVAESIRARESTRRTVRSELASARATARLMAGLPVLTLAMGSGSGGDPLAFLLGTGAGAACLATGLAFSLAGLWWIEQIASGVEAET